jgi:hypothetical protein
LAGFFVSHNFSRDGVGLTNDKNIFKKFETGGAFKKFENIPRPFLL